jgi:hypothetical protein
MNHTNIKCELINPEDYQLLNKTIGYFYFTLLSKFEDIKGVIRICKSHKNRQHNDQRKNENNKK